MTYREIPKNAPLATKFRWTDRHLFAGSIIMDRPVFQNEWCSYHCSWCGWQIEPLYEDYFSSNGYHAHEYCHNKQHFQALG